MKTSDELLLLGRLGQTRQRQKGNFPIAFPRMPASLCKVLLPTPSAASLALHQPSSRQALGSQPALQAQLEEHRSYL